MALASAKKSPANRVTTSIWKPSSTAALSGYWLMKLLEEAGLPPGVLNIVNGFGLEAGKPLASSPRISKIAFTGETSTGRLIMQYAAENLIPVTLELGGNDAARPGGAPRHGRARGRHRAGRRRALRGGRRSRRPRC